MGRARGSPRRVLTSLRARACPGHLEPRAHVASFTSVHGEHGIPYRGPVIQLAQQSGIAGAPPPSIVHLLLSHTGRPRSGTRLGLALGPGMRAANF